MKIKHTDIPGVSIIEPRVYTDERGFFAESFNKNRFAQFEMNDEFVQDNHSRSRRGVLRGLHYQVKHPQAKLCRVVQGQVFDVAVDLRVASPTFGRWVGVCLSDANHRQLYIPAGCAHGFCVLSELADFLYKCTDYYHPEYDRTVLWNDPDLAIDWPALEPLLSEKDRAGMRFREAPVFLASGLIRECKSVADLGRCQG